MSKDFFGSERKYQPSGAIATSELATVKVGGNSLFLVQSMRATYKQKVMPIYQAGDATVYFVQGQQSGNIEIGRAVGDGGFGTAFQDIAGACGTLSKLSVGLDGQGCAHIKNAGGLSFEGAVAEQYGANFDVQSLLCSESISVQCAFLGLS